jgi:hypothetical protein
MFPGKQPDTIDGQTQLCPTRHIYVCRDRIKRGEPAITLADAANGATIARARAVSLGEWTMRQYDTPQPCGSTVVLEGPDDAEWRITT